ncbi:MAG: hypothetical protein JWO83_841 [Caulobacteraceae bacterium]|nr:hypothetical protein [Caulobacteraceae bacterium]
MFEYFAEGLLGIGDALPARRDRERRARRFIGEAIDRHQLEQPFDVGLGATHLADELRHARPTMVIGNRLWPALWSAMMREASCSSGTY